MTTRSPRPDFPRSALRSATPVRQLNAADLGLAPGAPSSRLRSAIAADDPILVAVQALLADGYAGVILTGPPGTSKSWYAAQIAAWLADGDPQRVRFLQFHASYQYE